MHNFTEKKNLKTSKKADQVDIVVIRENGFPLSILLELYDISYSYEITLVKPAEDGSDQRSWSCYSNPHEINLDKFNCYGNFKLIMNDLDNRDADILKIIGFTYLGEPIYSVEFIARVGKRFGVGG